MVQAATLPPAGGPPWPQAPASSSVPSDLAAEDPRNKGEERALDITAEQWERFDEALRREIERLADPDHCSALRTWCCPQATVTGDQQPQQQSPWVAWQKALEQATIEAGILPLDQLRMKYAPNLDTGTPGGNAAL